MPSEKVFIESREKMHCSFEYNIYIYFQRTYSAFILFPIKCLNITAFQCAQMHKKVPQWPNQPA